MAKHWRLQSAHPKMNASKRKDFQFDKAVFTKHNAEDKFLFSLQFLLPTRDVQL